MAVIVEATRLEVETRQGAEGHRGHAGAQANAVLYLFGYLARCLFAPVFAVHHLDPDVDFVQFAAAIDVDGKFTYLGEAPHQILDGAGENVDAAHDERIVHPADNTALQAQERAPALTRFG